MWRKPLARFENQTFAGDVDIDGNEYLNCRFEHARLIYAGGRPPRFEGCSFDPVQFSFKGPAQNTLVMLKAMASEPKMRSLLRGTFPSLFGN